MNDKLSGLTDKLTNFSEGGGTSVVAKAEPKRAAKQPRRATHRQRVP